MITFPNAKINIGLNILRKRDDGFHEIESLFYPVGLFDVLEIIKSETFSFTSSGLDIPGDSSGNLCVKAFELMKQKYLIGNVKMHLHKVIPMGAGLGGGSADGAFAINMLNELFELNLSSLERQELAAQLGSDCAFFIEDSPAIAKGRGEVLETTSIDLKGKWIVLVNPGIHVGTAEAYAGALINEDVEPISHLIQAPIEQWQGSLVNGFEFSVFRNHPKIQEIKSSLQDSGAVYASMTGSGSTVFGIFNDEVDIDFPDCFVWKSQLT